MFDLIFAGDQADAVGFLICPRRGPLCRANSSGDVINQKVLLLPLFLHTFCVLQRGSIIIARHPVSQPSIQRSEAGSRRKLIFIYLNKVY